MTPVEINPKDCIEILSEAKEVLTTACSSYPPPFQGGGWGVVKVSWVMTPVEINPKDYIEILSEAKEVLTNN